MSDDEVKMVFWLDGEFQEETVAVDIRDRGYLLGDGLFETLLVRDGIPAFLDAHLARLVDGMKALHIEAVLPGNIGGLIQQLSQRNGFGQGMASARITVTRGASGRGLQFPVPEQSRAMLLLTMSGAPQGKYSSNDKASVIISKYCRAEKSITSRHKTLNYLDNLLARNEALDVGADEALMLNGQGKVACASAANVFLLDETGHIETPSIASGALPGIARKVLMGAAAAQGEEIAEVEIEASSLQSSYLILTNSLMGVHGACLTGQNQRWPARASRSLRLLQTWYDECLDDDLAERVKILSEST